MFNVTAVCAQAKVCGARLVCCLVPTSALWQLHFLFSTVTKPQLAVPLFDVELTSTLKY